MSRFPLSLLLPLLTSLPFGDARGGPILEFANRAACAADSRKPSHSVYVMVDAFTAGKWIDSWARARNDSDVAGVVARGLERFRLQMARVLVHVSEGLMSGRLPLLLSGAPPDARFLVPDPLRASALPEGTVVCRRIHRFSSLHSEGALGRPDRKRLEQMARDSVSASDEESDCLSPGPGPGSSIGRFLFRLEVSPWKRWDRMGFDFWHSLRTGLLLAWSQGREDLGADPEWGDLFRNLALDQMVVFFPGGCRSLDRPECRRDRISWHQLRSVLGSGAEWDPSAPPEERLLGEGPAAPPGAPVLPEGRGSQEWLQAVQERLTRIRGRMKLRKLRAQGSLRIAMEALSGGRLESWLRQLAGLPSARRKLQALCAETLFALDPEYGRFRSRIAALGASTETPIEAEDPDSPDVLREALRTGDRVLGFCAEARTAGLWIGAEALSPGEFATWYRIAALQETISPELPQDMGTLFNQAIPRAGSESTLEPLVEQEYFDGSGAVHRRVLCQDAGDCGRWVLQGLMDLLAVSESSTGSDLPLASSWLNPWALDVACGTYDPEGGIRRALHGLVSDLLSTAATGLSPVPIWVSSRPASSRVMGFEPGEGGLLQPVGESSGRDLSFGVDLASAIGVPCVAVGGGRSPELGLPWIYRMTGVRLQACTRSESNRILVRAGGEGARPAVRVRAACLACVLSPMAVPESLLSAAAAPAAQVIRMAAGLAATAVHFGQNLRDPVDIPRRWRVDVAKVRETWERHSGIPECCVRRLTRGRSCR